MLCLDISWQNSIFCWKEVKTTPTANVHYQRVFLQMVSYFIILKERKEISNCDLSQCLVTSPHLHVADTHKCKCFLYTTKSLSIFDLVIFTHSSCRSLRYCTHSMVKIYPQIFNCVSVSSVCGPCQKLQCMFLEVVHGRFEMCFESLCCCRNQHLFRFTFFTD